MLAISSATVAPAMAGPDDIEIESYRFGASNCGD
jgi:hypothetical protein